MNWLIVLAVFTGYVLGIFWRGRIGVIRAAAALILTYWLVGGRF